MQWFLLTYDRPQGRLLSMKPYDDSAHAEALRERFERELAEREHPEREVILLGAESLDALKQTHSRYFKTIEELIRDTTKLVEAA